MKILYYTFHAIQHPLWWICMVAFYYANNSLPKKLMLILNNPWVVTQVSLYSLYKVSENEAMDQCVQTFATNVVAPSCMKHNYRT